MGKWGIARGRGGFLQVKYTNKNVFQLGWLILSKRWTLNFVDGLIKTLFGTVMIMIVTLSNVYVCQSTEFEWFSTMRMRNAILL
jgi:hypothetical protein